MTLGPVFYCQICGSTCLLLEDEVLGRCECGSNMWLSRQPAWAVTVVKDRPNLRVIEGGKSMPKTYSYNHSQECADYEAAYLRDRPEGDPPCVCSDAYRTNEEHRVRCNRETLRSRPRHD